MAGTDGQTTNHLTDHLAQKPFEFDFYRAVRVLENLRRDMPRVGQSLSPSQDPVRFCQNPSLAFAPSTLEAFQPDGPGGFPRLFLRFFGMLGPNAPLPPHLTEYAFERKHHADDPTFVEFLNIFNHRLASFLYRTWAANQKALDLDRDDDHRYAVFFGSFFGLGMKEFQDRDAVQDHAKLFFTGRLACPIRNAEGLEAILQEYFEIPTRVETFVGRWMNLPPDSICRLGASPDAGRIGANTILGSRFYEGQLNFRIHLGPMKLVDYERMLPHGDAFRRLKYWVLNYCGEHFFWDMQLVLKAEEVPSVQLGKAGRLGWTTWLKTQPFTHDADDLILNPPGN